jgi:hypothetical protein
MANYPSELAQNAACQSHAGRLTGLWLLPKPAQGLNTNQSINVTNKEIYKIVYVCMYDYSPTKSQRPNKSVIQLSPVFQKLKTISAQLEVFYFAKQFFQ